MSSKSSKSTQTEPETIGIPASYLIPLENRLKQFHSDFESVIKHFSNGYVKKKMEKGDENQMENSKYTNGCCQSDSHIKICASLVDRQVSSEDSRTPKNSVYRKFQIIDIASCQRLVSPIPPTVKKIGNYGNTEKAGNVAMCGTPEALRIDDVFIPKAASSFISSKSINSCCDLDVIISGYISESISSGCKCTIGRTEKEFSLSVPKAKVASLAKIDGMHQKKVNVVPKYDVSQETKQLSVFKQTAAKRKYMLTKPECAVKIKSSSRNGHSQKVKGLVSRKAPLMAIAEMDINSGCYASCCRNRHAPVNDQNEENLSISSSNKSIIKSRKRLPSKIPVRRIASRKIQYNMKVSCK